MTVVRGASDDLIEFDGDVTGEVGAYQDGSVLLVFSDGTLLTAQYSPEGRDGIWQVTLLHKGSCFRRIEQCAVDDEDSNSDVAYFEAGLTWAYAARKWEAVN